MEYSVSLNGKFLKKGQMVGSMPEIPAELKVNPEDEIISGQWTNSEGMLQKLFFYSMDISKCQTKDTIFLKSRNQLKISVLFELKNV